MLNKVLRILSAILGGTTVVVPALTDSALAVTRSQQNPVAESNSKVSAIKADPGLNQSTDLLAYEAPSELLYDDIYHVWVRVEGNRAVVGITDYAQNDMANVVYVELSEEGAPHTRINPSDPIAIVESVKGAVEFYAPISGTVVSVNGALEDYPELVNEDPYGEGWLVVIEMNAPSELDELVDAAEYSGLTEY